MRVSAVLPILKARNDNHALELANVASDFERGARFAHGIVAGMTHINNITVDDQPNAPFGGEKNSGLGRFNGEWAMKEFTRAHWVTLAAFSCPCPIKEGRLAKR